MLGCWWRAYKLAQLRKLRANVALLLELWGLYDEVCYGLKTHVLYVIRKCESNAGHKATARARYFRWVEGKRLLEEVSIHHVSEVSVLDDAG